MMRGLEFFYKRLKESKEIPESMTWNQFLRSKMWYRKDLREKEIKKRQDFKAGLFNKKINDDGDTK